MKMKPLVFSLLPLALLPAANAGISVIGGGTGYDSNTRNWLSETANDIDGNGLGTDGYIFFGNFPVTTQNNNTNPGNDNDENIFGANVMSSTLLTASQPSYVSTAATGSGSSNIGRYAGYEAIDSPILADGTDRIAGNLLVSDGGEALEFTISGLAAFTTVRVGILTVLNDDTRARFDIGSISLTDGTDTETITSLPNLSSSADTTGPGWVFFDVDSDGDYSISMFDDGGDAPTVVGLGGVTFDTVPEPSSYALVAGMLALGSVMLRRRRA